MRLGNLVRVETKTKLSACPSSVGAARRFVRDVLCSRNISDRVTDTVVLLTSEVVTNALVHAADSLRNGAGPQLIVRVLPSRVRVEVHDPALAVPVRRFPPPLAASGRGIAIVDQLAKDWGVEHAARGKRVWFEVPVATAPLPFWSRGATQPSI